MRVSKLVLLRILPIAMACVMITGCYNQESFDNYSETRRQRLLEMYPVHKTTRKDVEARWAAPAQVKADRPAAGWEAEPDHWVKSYTTKAEARIGKKISRVERYYGANGLFSLCYCWFYYDSSDRLLDAEWQWSSD